MSFLLFESHGTSPSGKTGRWAVKNKTTQEVLGWIDWRSGWRRYVVNTASAMVFDSGCLREIADFLDAEMAKR